jgi:predicted metalloprotease with PDZ domain
MPFYMRLFTIAFLLIISISSYSQSAYTYTVDLTKVVNDRVLVELAVPAITAKEITFYLPKIVPGTYAIADFGRFIQEFQALDKNGKPLPVEKIETNGWKIKDASRLKKITYWVDDSFDTSLPPPNIFQPSGTNIEENKNFLLNTSGFFGYFEDMKQKPVEFNIIRDKEFYGSTGMIAKRVGDPVPKLKKESNNQSNDNKRVDVYEVENYDRLIDSPLMYCKPDTAIIQVANAEVLISSYSPNGKINAKEIANSVRDILMAQNKFLGGKLPVDKYAFLFYFTDQPVTIYGALEHSYSSVYYLPEGTIQEKDEQLRDFAAHEFFHIVTPLNIHSEEIHQFNFNDPKMSKHLWLYEGVTEYFAGLVQVKHGLITPEGYLGRLQNKFSVASNFIDTVAFTDISKFTLDKYSNQYTNVYYKGALIALALDIKLRSLSNGSYGVQNLMADLSKKFGKAQAFKDDELFTEITKLTYPEIGEFFKRYVNGPESIPFAEIFNLVGITYEKEQTVMELSLGFENRSYKTVEHNGKTYLAIRNVDLLNEQGKLLKFQNEDIIAKINGKDVADFATPAVQAIMVEAKQQLAEGKTLGYTVLRKNGDTLQEVELSIPAKKVARKKRHVLAIDPTASADKVRIRESWWKAGE